MFADSRTELAEEINAEYANELQNALTKITDLEAKLSEKEVVAKTEKTEAEEAKAEAVEVTVEANDVQPDSDKVQLTGWDKFTKEFNEKINNSSIKSLIK